MKSPDELWLCHYCHGEGYLYDDGEQGRDGRKVTCHVCHGKGVESEEEDDG